MPPSSPEPFAPGMNTPLAPGLDSIVPDEFEPDDAAPGTLPSGKSRSMFVRGLEVFVENKLAIVGVVILVLMVLFCYLGPFLYHTDQIHTNLAIENQAPGTGHPLGTDSSTQSRSPSSSLTSWAVASSRGSPLTRYRPASVWAWLLLNQAGGSKGGIPPSMRS